MQTKFPSRRAGERERSLVARVRSGLESVSDSLTVVEFGGSTPRVKNAKAVIRKSIDRIEHLRTRLVERESPHVKYVSDEIHAALNAIERARDFQAVSEITPYSVQPVGRETLTLIVPGRGTILDALGALREYVVQQFDTPEPLPPAPTPLEGMPSAADFKWDGGMLRLGQASADVPIFPFDGAERDHAQRLEACLIQAQDLAADLRHQRWQVREDYRIEVERYERRLPTAPASGNILLADAAARSLRDLFAAEADYLPAAFAARLKTFLQQHIALRPFYPEIAGFYRAVQSGHLEEALPLDAVSAVVSTVQAQTPILFDRSVAEAFDQPSPVPVSAVASTDPQVVEPDAITPPPDPLGEVDGRKAHDFLLAGTINRLWKVFRAGEQVHAAAGAWLATYASLSGPIGEILKWLQRYRGG